MKSISVRCGIFVLVALSLVVGPQLASVGAQDGTYKPAAGLHKVEAGVKRLEQEGDKLSKKTRDALLMEGRAILDFEERTRKGNTALQREMRAYPNKRYPRELRNRIISENAKFEARINAFARDVQAAFARAQATAKGKGQTQPTTVLTSKERGRPLDAPLTSTTTNRSVDLLQRIINQFDVERNPRYEGDTTYCNIFVWDVTRALGAEIPHWVDVKETTANTINDWLHAGKRAHGWRQASAEEAQENANAGRPSIASWKNPNSSLSGHIAVVRPGNIGEKGPAHRSSGEEQSQKQARQRRFWGP